MRPRPAARDSTGVVLSRIDPTATFNPDEWAGIGGWGGKEIKAGAEVTAGWHELEFDATKYLHPPARRS